MARHVSTWHVQRIERVEPRCSTSSTLPKCMGSTRRTCRVVLRRDVMSQVEFGNFWTTLYINDENLTTVVHDGCVDGIMAARIPVWHCLVEHHLRNPVHSHRRAVRVVLEQVLVAMVTLSNRPRDRVVLREVDAYDVAATDRDAIPRIQREPNLVTSPGSSGELHVNPVKIWGRIPIPASCILSLYITCSHLNSSLSCFPNFSLF